MEQIEHTKRKVKCKLIYIHTCVQVHVYMRILAYVCACMFLLDSGTTRLEKMTAGTFLYNEFSKVVVVKGKFQEPVDISFSAGGRPRIVKNVVRVPEEYIVEDDPRRFRSLHCFLYRKH
ncbi:unnamed protein product, partial [Brugia timori]|uniref:Dirigent protein n=1 Tax=Brugia timori TaxID=42155 RepID=A0A0R3QDD7_9BILA